jgi:hypothetical protein
MTRTQFYRNGIETKLIVTELSLGNSRGFLRKDGSKDLIMIGIFFSRNSMWAILRGSVSCLISTITGAFILRRKTQRGNERGIKGRRRESARFHSSLLYMQHIYMQHIYMYNMLYIYTNIYVCVCVCVWLYSIYVQCKIYPICMYV